MNSASLLQSVQHLSAPERDRAVIQHARGVNLGTVLADLDNGGIYERRLGALMASAARDIDWVRAHVSDAHPLISWLALKAAVQIVPEVLIDALKDAPAARRAAVVRVALRAGIDAHLADGMVPYLAPYGTERASILAACSQQVVAAMLPSVMHAVATWRALAVAQTDTVLAVLAADLATAPNRNAWWNKYALAYIAALRASPRAVSAVLDALERYPPISFPPDLSPGLRFLAKGDPGRVLRLLTTELGQTIDNIPKSTLRRLARSRLPEVHLYAAILRFHDLARPVQAQAPRDRGTTFNAAMAGQGLSDLQTSLLDALPRKLAAELARKQLAATAAQGKPRELLVQLQVYYPPEEARPVLLEWTRKSDRDDRALGWRQLIRNAIHWRDGMDQVVAAMDARLRNEQNPVRDQAFDALRLVPTRLFTPESLPHLTTVFQNAIDAIDFAEAFQIVDIATRALSQKGDDATYATWAMDVIARVNKGSRISYLGIDSMPRKQAVKLCESLLPYIKADSGYSNYAVALALARALGKHLNDVPDLVTVIEKAIFQAKVGEGTQAVGHWLAPKATREERVRHILKRDASAMGLVTVSSIVTSVCTDLVDIALGKPPYGRFLHKGTIWTLPVSPGEPLRWTPGQTEKYVGQLQAVAQNTKAYTGARRHAVKSIGMVPGGLDLTRAWVRDEDVPIAEAALMSLKRSPQDVPLLLSFADGDCARVAIHAVTSASRFVAPSRLEPMLEGVLASRAKVTSRKEVIRLAAQRLPSAAAAAFIQRALSAPDVHKDVRAAAVLFSALYLLGTDAGWDIVETAETDKDEAVGLAAARVTPLSIDAEYHARYAKLIGSIAQSADDQVARAALDCLQYWAPYAVDTVPAILGQALVHMGRANKAVWTSAADSLVLISSTMTGERALAAAVEQLVQYGPQPDSGDESDRPPYRRIQYVANSLGEKVRTDLRTYRASGLSLSALFATHQLVREAAVLRCASIELDGNVLCELEQVIALCTDRPLLAFQTSNSFRQRLSRYVGSSGPFVTVASQLAATGRLADGLFAVAIVQQYGARLKWPAEWRDLVRSLRSHPSLDVREIATCLNTA